MSTHIPIPAGAAKRVAHEHGKDVVVILAIDDVHAKTDAVGYGRTGVDQARAKRLAAELRDGAAGAGQTREAFGGEAVKPSNSTASPCHGVTASPCSAWIPVGREMPGKNVDVLIAITHPDKPVIWLGYFDGEEFRVADGAVAAVTHWMALPAGPQEQSDPCCPPNAKRGSGK